MKTMNQLLVSSLWINKKSQIDASKLAVNIIKNTQNFLIYKGYKIEFNFLTEGLGEIL